MRLREIATLGVCLSLAIGSASAEVTSEQADQLGKSLTAWGAEQAGSSDKLIPPYTGGLTASDAPAGWKKGSGRYDVGPYDSEKASFSITNSNVGQYADKLTAGAVALLKRYPDFRMDVYPTHRSAVHSDYWLSHCKTNAVSAKITPSNDGVTDAHSCVPFPIPKSGAEVIWNAVLTDIWGPRSDVRISSWVVDADGHLTDVGRSEVEYVQLYQDAKTKTLPDGTWQISLVTSIGPPAQVGVKALAKYPLNYDKDDYRAWLYMPGQRRTRLAPEMSYDTPAAQVGGATNFDERNGFTGQLDRYDFKLIGKKEVYIPYNSNRLFFAPQDKMLANRVANPATDRWELHRVWVVEATLKPGKRHVEPKRTFYVDEDTWAFVASDAYDQAGKLFKIGFYPTFPLWDAEATAQTMVMYDLSSGLTYLQAFNRPDDYIRPTTDIGNLSRYTAAALTAGGVR